MEQFLFPFGCVPQGCRIIIYGAGMVGQYFLQEVQTTSYCEVLALADRNWQNYEGEDIPVIPPERINDFPYELIVVAVRNDSILPGIVTYLTEELEIPAESVVAKYSRIKMNFCPPHRIGNGWNERAFAYKHKGESFAFLVDGGLGDVIIAKKYVVTILNLAREGYHVDIFGKQSFILAVFGVPVWLNNIYPEADYWREYMYYDLAVHTRYLMQVNNLNQARLSVHNPHLCEIMMHMQGQIEKYGLAYQPLAACYIHFARCRYRGLNAYNCYNELGGISINSMKVDIPLVSTLAESVKSMSLVPYVTVHYGWGVLPEGTIRHVKIWPVHYFEQLIEMMHMLWREIKIVQVGSADEQRLPGVSRYFMGEDIEQVKHILQGSMLHIDNEGGIVHLATQLGTKCIVLFGPTPVWYFGYPQNINIVAESCNSCCYLDGNFASCPRHLEKPECMYSITPTLVFYHVKNYLEQVYKN